MRFGFLALSLISSMSAAQTTTTNCWSDSLGNTRCTSEGQSNVIQDFARQYQRNNQAAAEASREADRRRGEQQGAARAQQQTLKAAQMIIGGDCAGAATYALSVGNFSLAQEVRNYCK